MLRPNRSIRPATAAVIVAIVLGTFLITPARAESLDTAGKQIYAGIAVVGVAAVVGVVFLVRHEKHKAQPVTGCVASGKSGLTFKDEAGGQVYGLSGLQNGINPGEKMTLAGRRHGKAFEARSIVKDLGPCQT